MREIEAKNGGKFIVPEKGESANPNGRPKSINRVIQDYFLDEKNIKLSKNQINEILMSFFSKSVQEIAEIHNQEDTPSWLKLLAKKFKKDYEKGDLEGLNFLFDRSIGRPKQSIEERQVDKDGNDILTKEQNDTIDKAFTDIN